MYIQSRSCRYNQLKSCIQSRSVRYNQLKSCVQSRSSRYNQLKSCIQSRSCIYNQLRSGYRTVHCDLLSQVLMHKHYHISGWICQKVSAEIGHKGLIWSHKRLTLNRRNLGLSTPKLIRLLSKGRKLKIFLFN